MVDKKLKNKIHKVVKYKYMAVKSSVSASPPSYPLKLRIKCIGQ